MKQPEGGVRSRSSRRSFLRNGIGAAGALTVGAGVLGKLPAALSEEPSGSLPRGDAAILRFLCALEIIESDLWQQYAELGGASNQPGLSPIDLPFATGGSLEYIAALERLDMDMPQYIADNTDDEFSHAAFLKAYLKSKGALIGELANDLKDFRRLPSSQADGANKTAARVTNLMQLSVDTSWWTRYRSDAHNPDLEPNFVFPQAIPSLAVGEHPAIPRNNADLAGSNANTNPPTITAHLQAIANTAGFHFAFIEQGGSSLYPSLAQRVTSTEVLRILLSIGPTETAHFQTWHDKAGNAPNVTDGNLDFSQNLNGTSDPDLFQTNLIMPEPTPFLSPDFPICSIIRPTETERAAMGAVKALTADGLFRGQKPAFFEFLRDLAEDADEARRKL
jgi:hypothetical protein